MTHKPAVTWMVLCLCWAALVASPGAAQTTTSDMPQFLDETEGRPSARAGRIHSSVDDDRGRLDDEHSEVREDSPFELGARLALASPIGAIGLEGHVRLQSWWTISVGTGLGTSGAQAAWITALHGRVSTGLVSIASGVSVGRYDSSNDLTSAADAISHVTTPTFIWASAWWWNTELSMDFGGGHTIIRPFIGLGVPILERAPECIPSDSGEPSDCSADTIKRAKLPVLPLIGVAFIVW